MKTLGLLFAVVGLFLASGPGSILFAQPAVANRERGQLRPDVTLADPGSISGTLRTFNPALFHAVVLVQLMDATNQVVATVLSGDNGRYEFTNAAPGAYRVRCHVLGGFRYYGLDRLVTAGTLTNAGPEIADVPSITLG